MKQMTKYFIGSSEYKAGVVSGLAIDRALIILVVLLAGVGADFVQLIVINFI